MTNIFFRLRSFSPKGIVSAHLCCVNWFYVMVSDAFALFYIIDFTWLFLIFPPKSSFRFAFETAFRPSYIDFGIEYSCVISILRYNICRSSAVFLLNRWNHKPFGGAEGGDLRKRGRMESVVLDASVFTVSYEIVRFSLYK